jgi:hypothetical protein
VGADGRGITIQAGHQLILPASFLSFSANPLKGGGRLYRHGLAWFSHQVFGDEILAKKERFEEFVRLQIGALESFLRASDKLKEVNFDGDDPAIVAQRLFEVAGGDKLSSEWFALVATSLYSTVINGLADLSPIDAIWATAVAERYRSLWIFKQNFEEAVWMAQSAKTLIETLSVWQTNRTNDDEEFWQARLQEWSYVLSQLFSSPVTFIKGKAYVGGQQVDGRSARFVDFLFSGGAGDEAILIEIKTPKTPLLQKSKYRSSIHAPSTDLSGSVVQMSDYRDSLISSYRDILSERSVELSAFRPKSIVIIGDYSGQLADAVKRRSFELYRSSLANVEIVTFDELFRKVEHLAKLFNLVVSKPG